MLDHPSTYALLTEALTLPAHLLEPKPPVVDIVTSVGGVLRAAIGKALSSPNGVSPARELILKTFVVLFEVLRLVVSPMSR